MGEGSPLWQVNLKFISLRSGLPFLTTICAPNLKGKTSLATPVPDAPSRQEYIQSRPPHCTTTLMTLRPGMNPWGLRTGTKSMWQTLLVWMLGSMDPHICRKETSTCSLSASVSSWPATTHRLFSSTMPMYKFPPSQFRNEQITFFISSILSFRKGKGANRYPLRSLSPSLITSSDQKYRRQHRAFPCSSWARDWVWT